jgi:peptide/nickel transport system substrate-binding protein
VGTGPYRLADRSSAETLRFVANPNYREPGLPKIREIVFQRHDAIQMVDAFLQRNVELVYGLNKEHVNQLDQHGKKIVALETPAVWFLAPNFRNPLLRNRNLRLAIAHAIDREAILNQFFRPGRGQADHVALSGPFPAGCWAYNPSVEQFSPQKAPVFANLAKQELKQEQRIEQVQLVLVYPRGNPDVEAACREAEKQVEAAVGIELKLVGFEPNEFQRQIVDLHEFDLAYWCHQFDDATYWIEPLLDDSNAAREPGGPNFMGYVPDVEMAALFRDIRLHKQFAEIQAMTRKLHEHIARNAIVIPLWQLKTYVAVSDRLENAALDPVTLYGDVERWTLKAR